MTIPVAKIISKKYQQTYKELHNLKLQDHQNQELIQINESIKNGSFNLNKSRRNSGTATFRVDPKSGSITRIDLRK